MKSPYSSVTIKVPQDRLEHLHDYMFDLIDNALWDRHFDTIEFILENCDVPSTPVSILLTILTATAPAKSKLIFREGFYSRVEGFLAESGQFEEGLLNGLE